MKHLFYIILLGACLINIEAQTCLPDSTLKDSSAGVYPKPISPTNPNGGITKTACINKPYEFTFTVVVPDTVEVPIFPSPIALEKVSIDTTGAILNLPEGISYACNPPNCIFKKNTFGCLSLFGTPNTNNQAGDFKPIIKLKLTVNVGIPFDYNTEYPGPAFPGEYILKLVNEADCASSNTNLRQTENTWFPIPSYDGQFSSKGDAISEIKVFNSYGKQVLYLKSPTNSQITLPDEGYTDGLYIIHWSEGNYLFKQKLIVLQSH